MAHTNLTIEPTDHVLPCPVCGGQPELLSTHTAAYWLARECGAEVHGDGFGGNHKSENIPRKRHDQPKKSALDARNRRMPGAAS